MPEGFISTGVIGLDIIMGGGWKRGTMNEIWGETGTGKTTLALESVRARAEGARPVMWISTRGTIDFQPDVPDMIVAEPKTAERAFDVAMSASGVGSSFIIFDDANHLVRAQELIDDDYVPDEHREFKNELKMLKQVVKNSGATVLFLSQPRDRMRAPIRGTGISEKSYDRISLAISQQSQDKTAFVAAMLRRTGTRTNFVVQPGRGINRARQLLYYGVKAGLIWTNGSWYSFDDGWKTEQVQGAEQFETYMVRNEHVADLLEYKLRAHYGIDTAYVVAVG